ncbi:MAG TPA: protein kinase [Blastocatellia bacterium]|nr:protein kinase [Blastocatellia bacterium]
MALTAGTKISHYMIVSRLGVGGMGEVYKAEDTLLDRPVALKILPADLVDNEDRVRRFVQEAKSASALNHPHIVTIYEIGKVELENGEPANNGSNGSPAKQLYHYIAMEFIDGDTLRDKIHRDRTELKKLLEYFAQVADGLSKAHASGIVHRDLKPENVMITHDGYAKILDFGLAKLLEPQKPASADDILEAETMMMGRTQPGIVMGTIGYMSPEQVQGKVVDQRSDIFSFGCILYEATTGHKPFHGESVIDSLHKIVYSQAPPIREFNPETPAELQRIIRKCLSKDPDERYQSIKDANIDLRELVREYDSQPSVSAYYSTMTSAYPHTSSNPDITMLAGSAPAPSARDRKPWLWVAMGAAGALAVGAIIIIAIQLISGTRGGTGSNAPFGDVRINRLTNTGKSELAAISPDGKYIAHAVNDGGKQSLWVRHVATSRNVEIVPPSEGKFSGISFSRDSNYVYYTVIEKNRPVAILYQIGALGGTPKRLVEDVDSPISISPDNTQFVFMRGYPIQRRHELVIVNMDGSGERTLAVRNSPAFYNYPAWSPDGRVIACSAGTGAGGAYMNIVAVNVADGTEKPIISETWLDVGRVSWDKDGTALIMTATDPTSKVSQVWRVTYPEGEPRRITNDLNQYVSASLTEDSDTLAVVERDSLSNLWTAPAGDASRARQVTSGIGKYGRVSWTPDGKMLYNTRDGSDLNIWRMDADGGNQKQLTADSGMNFHAAASPDGRYIVFASSRGVGPNDYNIWRMDADGSNPKQLTQGNSDVSPAFSPDGKWIVYQSHVSSRPHLWKVSIDGGQATQLTNATSWPPSVSPDGRYIACGYWNEQLDSPFSVVLIPFEGGQPIKSFNIPIGLLRWAADGSGLMFIDNKGGVSNIWLQPLAGGEPKQLTNFKSDLIFSFDLSRDRQFALSRGLATSDVFIISNLK